MKLSDFTQHELNSITAYLRIPLTFQYNTTNNSFEGHKGEVHYSVSREFVEDVLSFNFVNYLITRKVEDQLDERLALKELIMEDLCGTRWHLDNPGKHPEDAQCSKCVSNYHKFIYFKFADEMVETILEEYIKLT